MTEYRQDDRTDTGYCPICGERVITVFVDGAGWCPDHGRVWCEWQRPRRDFECGYPSCDCMTVCAATGRNVGRTATANGTTDNEEGSDAA